MASPFPFTSGQVLTAAELNSIGEATAFTPSWTNLTVGNGTQSFYYAQVQDILLIDGELVFGSTTAITGNVDFSNPVGTLAVSGVPIGIAYLADADGAGGAVARNKLATISSAINQWRIFSQEVSGSLIQSKDLSSSSPFTWATGDRIRISGKAVLS